MNFTQIKHMQIRLTCFISLWHLKRYLFGSSIMCFTYLPNCLLKNLLYIDTFCSIVQGADWHWGPKKYPPQDPIQPKYVRDAALATLILCVISFIAYLVFLVSLLTLLTLWWATLSLATLNYAEHGTALKCRRLQNSWKLDSVSTEKSRAFGVLAIGM
jgi:hypothetical protein